MNDECKTCTCGVHIHTTCHTHIKKIKKKLLIIMLCIHDMTCVCGVHTHTHIHTMTCIHSISDTNYV